MEQFGAKLKNLRLVKGYTQTELAKALGVSASAIGMYEKGHRLPTIDFVVKVGAFFKVSTDYLVGVEKIPESVEEILSRVRDSLVYSGGITFNGVRLGRNDTRRLFDAMHVAAHVILNQKLRDDEAANER